MRLDIKEVYIGEIKLPKIKSVTGDFDKMELCFKPNGEEYKLLSYLIDELLTEKDHLFTFTNRDGLSAFGNYSFVNSIETYKKSEPLELFISIIKVK